MGHMRPTGYRSESGHVEIHQGEDGDWTLMVERPWGMDRIVVRVMNEEMARRKEAVEKLEHLDAMISDIHKMEQALHLELREWEQPNIALQDDESEFPLAD